MVKVKTIKVTIKCDIIKPHIMNRMACDVYQRAQGQVHVYVSLWGQVHVHVCHCEETKTILDGSDLAQ